MRIVQITSLGKFGRWGNQCLQYAFARAYAEKHGAVLEIPDWIGRRVFDIPYHPISRKLQRCRCDVIPWGQTNIDLHGYFQNDVALRILSRAKLRAYLQLKPEWLSRFPKPRDYYVAAHVRRGDYASQFSTIFCLVSRQSYLNACDTFGLDKEKLLWVSEESQQPSDLESEGLGFLPDFLTLMQADVILRANSTFSWMAAALSNAKVFSPLVESLVGEQDVPFVEGNWPKFLDMKNNPGESSLHTNMVLKE